MNGHGVVAPTNSSYKRVLTLREKTIYTVCPSTEYGWLCYCCTNWHGFAAKNPVFLSNQMGQLEPLVVTFAYLRVNKCKRKTTNNRRQNDQRQQNSASNVW
jgi:hypothetical protein